MGGITSGRGSRSRSSRWWRGFAVAAWFATSASTASTTAGLEAGTWALAPPDQHRVSAPALERLREHLQQSEPSIRALLLLRDGRPVFEYHRAGLDPQALHPIHSITKSVVSTLVGIAIAQGRLDSAERPLASLLDEAKAPGTAPHVDHLFPQKPANVAAAWGRDVLRAVGQRGMATYTIVDASATETALPRSTGMTQVFKTEQSDRYDLHIEVKLEVGNPLLASTGFVTASVNRSQTVAEDMSLNERETVWFQMTESAMRELDEKLEAAIKDKLQPFVR